jgi:hypothetical protein
MKRIRIIHNTEYHYHTPVAFEPHQACYVHAKATTCISTARCSKWSQRLTSAGCGIFTGVPSPFSTSLSKAKS